MKNQLFSTLILLGSTHLQAQVSGNATWNDNNRFKNSSSYSGAGAPDAFGTADADYEGRADVKGKKVRRPAPQTATATSYQWSFGDRANGMNPVISSGESTDLQIRILKNASPTSYTAIFHINQAGEKVSELDSTINKRVRKLMALGAEIGLKPKDFYADMIALVPVFRKEKKFFSSTYIEVPKGFEMQKNLHIRYDHAWQLDRLFSMAALCEIYDLIKVEYHYDSLQLAHSEMRKKAQDVLKLRTAHLKSLGIDLDTSYRTATEAIAQVNPVDQYIPYQPMAISAIAEDGVTDPNSRPNRSTLFHNRMSEDKFDAVINPSPLEPSIQITYTLQVHYDRKIPQRVETKTVTKTKMLMVTPQGQITERWLE
jgi:hypothetical protein